MTKLSGERWTAYLRRGRWDLRYYVAPGDRRQHRLPGKIQHPQEARRYIEAFVAEELRISKATKEAAFLRDGRINPRITYRQLGELWTSGELAKRYPRWIQAKKSADDDETRLRKHVYEHLGDIPIAAFKAPRALEWAEGVIQSLPAALSESTVRHVAQVLRRVLTLATYPCIRLLPANPIPEGFLPRVKSTKAKSYVYPDEDAQLMADIDVPLVLRLFFGFLIREGSRVGEVRTMQLGELDLEHDWVHVDETKTGYPRDWPLDPGTAEALRRYQDRVLQTEDPEAYVFLLDGQPLDPYSLAEELRTHLKKAGIRRPQLFEHNGSRQKLRAHDLRASFVTVNLAAGKTESWIADRTGHMSSQMINRYKRWARSHREGNLGTFKPLYEAIPELRDERDK